MKNKIFVFFSCTMLVVLSVIPISNCLKIQNSSNLVEIVDQSQEIDEEMRWLVGGVYYWQEFVPSMSWLVRVECKLFNGHPDSPPFNIELLDPDDNVMGSFATLAIPLNSPGWVTASYGQTVDLVPGEKYKIRCWFEPGGEYAWCGADGDPYLSGDSDVGQGWDWCFRSISDTNHRPDPPEIVGPPNCYYKEDYVFDVTFTDPDGDDLEYIRVEFGDGNDTGYIGPVSSGYVYHGVHHYTLRGYYNINASSRDIHGAFSDKSKHRVQVSRNKESSFNNWNLLMDMFPIIQKILNIIL